MEQFWASRHLATIFILVSKVAVAVPDEFRRFVPRLIRRLLTSLDELQVAEWSTSEVNSSSAVGKIESEKLGLILRSINSLRGVLGEYLHMLVPALLKLSDSLASLCTTAHTDQAESVFNNLHVLSLRTTSSLLECQRGGHFKTSTALIWETGHQVSMSTECGLSARTVQPLVRVLRSRPPISRDVGLAAIESLCVCAKHIGGSRWFQSYHVVVRTSISDWDDAASRAFANKAASIDGNANPTADHEEEEATTSGLEYYNDAVSMMKPPPLRGKSTGAYFGEDLSLPPTKSSMISPAVRQLSFVESPAIAGATENSEIDPNTISPFQPTVNPASRQRVNQGNLQRAWDVTQIASRDDWEQWMRTLSIQLLREAPSPALRATANLAHAYQVRKLRSASSHNYKYVSDLLLCLFLAVGKRVV